jgi:hypothetical protein
VGATAERSCGLRGSIIAGESDPEKLANLVRGRVKATRSWAGLCPRLGESAGAIGSRKVLKGNKWLKAALRPGVHAALQRQARELGYELQPQQAA